MEFRSKREQVAWDKLVKELSGTEIDPDNPDTLGKKIGLLHAAVGMLPFEPKVLDSLKKAVTKLRADAARVKAGKTQITLQLTKSIRDLETRVIKEASRKDGLPNPYWDKRLATEKGRSTSAGASFDNKAELRARKAQLLEAIKESNLGSDVAELKKALVLSIKALEKGDVSRYKELQTSIESSIPEDMEERFSDIRESIKEEVAEQKQRRRELLDSIKSTVTDAALNLLDRLGIGGLNLGNLVRLSSSLLKVTGKALWGTASFVSRTGVNLANAYRVRKAVNEVQSTVASGDIEAAKEDRQDKQRSEFLSLFRKQVDFVKDLVQTKEERESSSFLGSFAKMVGGLFSLVGGGAAGLLGGKLTWATLKTALLGLGKMSMGVIAGLGATLLGLFGTAAKAGGGVIAWLGRMAVRFLPFLLKRAVVLIPVVGTLLAGILWGKDIYEAVQSFVMPYIQPMVNRMAEWLKETWSWTKDKFSQVVSSVKAFVEPVQQAVSTAVNAIGGFLESPLRNMKELFSWLGEKAEGIPWLGKTLKRIPELLSSGYSAVSKAVTDTALPAISSTLDSVQGAVSGGRDAIGSLAEKGKTLASEVTSAVTNKAKAGFGSAVNMFSSGYDAIKSSVGKLFSVSPSARLEGVNPELQERFAQMVQEYRARGGKQSVVITSGFRTTAEQADLYSKYGPGRAAPPGSSLHERGFAIDASSAALNDMNGMGLLSKYGLSRPVPGEPWHLQPEGLSKSATRAGIYSADAAVHQGGVSQPSIRIQPEKVTPVAPFREGYEPGSKAKQELQSSNKTGVSQKVSVDSIPTFSYNDGAFFAANLGLLAP